MRRAARMLAHPMIICPACGKENEDVASECKRCRAPLREEAAADEIAMPQSLGEVCRRCEAYNEPGVSVCTNCGLQLFAAPASGQPPLDKTPPDAFTPPSQVPETLSEELPAETFEDATMESSPVALDEPVPAESAAEPIPEEQPPPFAAKLVLQNGSAEGTEFALGHLENSLGGSAAHIGLGDDPFIAPHAATLAFVDERLVLRDEGSANGVYVRVRESAALEPGDLFVAGERLLRYEGPVEMVPPAEGDLPLLGAPRPAQGPVYRVTEVLLGAKTGRTCHRGGTVISIGRAGCDMNFAGDSLLAAKHAEIRIAEDGTAALADLAHGPSGVFLRVRAQQPVELQAGDVVRVGDQHLRVDVG